MCNLDSSTIELLWKYQCGRLKSLEVCSYFSGFYLPRGAPSNFLSERLVINSMFGYSVSFINNWIRHVIEDSHISLRKLTIGYEDLARVAYAKGNISEHISASGMQTECTRYLAPPLSLVCRPVNDNGTQRPLKLNSVRLLGVDLFVICNFDPGPIFDFDSLKSLTLESCSNIEPVLSALPGERSLKGMQKLRSLTIRSEFRSETLQGHLQAFLCSLTRLNTLVLMLDGVGNFTIDLETVLAVHGNTLQKLVWDARTGCRNNPSRSVSLVPPLDTLLDLISCHCPNLVELGGIFDWHTISTDQDRVCNIGNLGLYASYNRNRCANHT